MIPDKSVDLVVTDPPYGIGYKYLSYNDTQENLQKLIYKVMPEILRISKRCVLFSGVQNIWLYPKADWCMSYSWNTTATYGKMGYNQWQPILFYGQDIKGFGSVNGILKSDSISFSGGNDVGFRRQFNDKGHCCPKPLNIIKSLVARLSNEGDTILDPFMGSWTTARACKDLSRNFIGFELEEDYCRIGEKRLQQLNLF